MAWEEFVRNDVLQGLECPFVTITPTGLFFNAAFTRSADIADSEYVRILVDAADRKLGFEFQREKAPNCFALKKNHKDKKRLGKFHGLSCSSAGLFSKYPWVRSVSKLHPKERRFAPRKEGGVWAIYLAPAFEEQNARESKEIPTEAQGVYRYVREGGEIVYIGRGWVRRRLAEPQRQEWDFDRVEYSIIESPDKQVFWETYWIDRFKEEHKGSLPFYNRVSGASCAPPDGEGDASGGAS
jgi:hypothetical protein